MMHLLNVLKLLELEKDFGIGYDHLHKKKKKKYVQMLLFIVVNALSYTWLVYRHANLNEGNKDIN